MAAQSFNMPKYGQTMEEGTVVEWKKREGDTVLQGEMLVEIQADKSNMEVESELEGVVLAIVVEEGATVPCGTPLCWIGQEGDLVPK